MASRLSDPVPEAVDPLRDWRDAAKRVARTWEAWIAAERPDRARTHGAYVEALEAEELAASRVAEAA